MDWNSAPMAWLLLLDFLAVLVSSQHYPHDSRDSNRHHMSPLDLLELIQSSSKDNVKGPSSWTAVDTQISTPPQSTSRSSSTTRVPRPVSMGVLSGMNSESGQLAPTESNISGLARQPAGTLPALTIIPASSLETNSSTSTQSSISVFPPMEGPGIEGPGSSGTAEASTSSYLTLASSDLGNATSTATLESDASKPASITLASAELSSPVVPKLPVLVIPHPKETETPTPEPSRQPESESPPIREPLPTLIQDTNPASDANVSNVDSGSRGPSTLSSLATLLLLSPTRHLPSPSSSLLPSTPMILNASKSTTSGIPRVPSVPASMSMFTESSTNTSTLQSFHQTTHQEGLEPTISDPSRFPPSGSTLTTGLLAPEFTVISDATSVMESSPTSVVSLENFSSISSASSPTTPSVHLTSTPTITPYLSWSHPSMTESVDSSWRPTSDGTELSMPSASSSAHNSSLQDLIYQSPDYNHVTRPLSFKITNEIFTTAFYDPTSLEYKLLSENVQNQLTPIYQRAFSSFDRVEVNGFRLGSVVANTTIVFGNKTRAPSPMDIVWVLYREVKGVGMMLGNLSLAENSIQSEASTLTTLAPLTVHVSLTTMEPFVSSLLRPGSATYTILEGQTMGSVTPVVLGFYGMHPQERPLLLFSNDDQWVAVTIVYKFNVPVPVGLRGLADRLAREVTDTHIQKSSISVNEEKAELAVYSLWLRIPSWPFTEALRDKASRDSRELRRRLTHGLTTILKPTRNFAEVIVEEFVPSPTTARVRPTYFSAAPSEAEVHQWVSQGLGSLEDAEGLQVELAGPGLDLPSSRPSTQPKVPGYAVAMISLGLLLLLIVPLALVLAFKTNLCSRIAGLCVRKPRYGRQVTASEYTMHSYDLKH
ncbi:uncharacterized protein LOC141558979 [Sminthopsis crassicaudata]|uniref:uncharacterized protein LOC141558979 n=1 Tax=Sminthopsis crassicaudata TaxID=9301 RepID=UPI003D688D87